MGEEIGLTIRYRAVGQKGQMDEAAKQATRAAEGVKKSLGGLNLSQLVPKSFRGMMGSLGGGGLGKAAVAGGVAGLAMAGVQGILDILKKMFSLMLEASPMLRATVKLLNQGFMMILRPLGDTLSMMLRPIAQFFRVIGRQVMKQMRAKRAELKAQGLSGGALGAALMEEMPTMYLQVLIDALANVDWGDIWNKYLDLVWTNITERFPAFLATLWGGLLGVRDGLISKLSEFPQWLWGIMTDISKWGMDVLTGFGTWVWDSLTGKISFGDRLTSIGGKFYDLFVTVYNTFAGYFNKVFGFFGVNIAMLKTSAELAADAYNSAYARANYIPGIDAKTGHSYAYRDSEMPRLATGGNILKTGVAIVDRGERVLNPDQAASYGSGTMNVSIAIPGSALADAIDRRIDSYFRTKVVARR